MINQQPTEHQQHWQKRDDDEDERPNHITNLATEQRPVWRPREEDSDGIPSALVVLAACMLAVDDDGGSR
jgi:hypothetical protein